MVRILVAEDNTSLLGAIRDTLELDGYRVCGVTNGLQALEAFSRFRPQVIITDVAMPEMDGFELYYQVRRESPGMAIPFVFISVKDVAQAVRQVTSSSSAHFLRKPFSTEELLEAVRKFLQ
jgi:CheY-like chemotaxis protein